MSETVVTIERLVFGGTGLARTDQGIVFISDVAPGETVAIERCGRKGGVACGRPVKILKASPARRDPPCPLAGTCGGCDWLHLIYKEQLAAKTEIFLECMRRIGGIKNLPSPDIVAAEEFGYRHRAQLNVDTQGNTGFFARRTNSVVPVRRCPLLTGPLNTLLDDCSERKAAVPGQVKNFRVISGDNDRVASYPVIDGHTLKSVTITAGARTFEVRPEGFFQSNRPLLERLGSWALTCAGEGGRCVDLYGGSGFFSGLGNFFSGLTGIATTLAPTAANLWTDLKKSDAAKKQAAAQSKLASTLLAFLPMLVIGGVVVTAIWLAFKFFRPAKAA